MMDNPIILEEIDGETYERHGLAIKYDQTKRGFKVFDFKDMYGSECSLQDSSLATESAIWFGTDDPWPKVFYPIGIKHPDHGGWEDYKKELPEGADNILCSGRMHLTLDQVKELLPLLQYFVEHGELPDGVGKYTANGRKIHNIEETKKLDFPFPPEKEL